MHDAMHIAHAWVIAQLRFPQRAPHTTVVAAWSNVPATTQSAVADLSDTIPDINTLVAQPSWWRTITGRPRRYPQLTDGQRADLRRACIPLHWPLREEGPEIRLVAIAENTVARIVADPAWTHPLLSGHRSVLGFTIELHAIAAAAHELLTLRMNTPPQPTDDGTAQLSRARAEWDRRHVVAAHAEAGLIDRVAALRAYEDALTSIRASLDNLRAVAELSAGGGAVDRLYEGIVAAECAVEQASVLRNDMNDVRADLDARVAYLDSLIAPHRDA